MRRGGRAIVIGGGLAGLACARELGNACTLLEAEDRLGGLCRTDVIDGFSFDWTGHWLHARDPEMRKLIQERWLGGNLLEVQRRARIYSERVCTTFPYQLHLHGLPARTISDCVLGFIDATLGPEGEELRSRPLANAAEFILRHLGEGIARHFMFPYNEKLYTVACEHLSPEWGGRFIPRPSLEDVVTGGAGPAREDVGYNATFWYPREGGIEALPRGISAELRADVRLSSRVQSVDLARRRIRLVSGEELEYDALVLTAPLPACARLLAQPRGRIAAARGFGDGGGGGSQGPRRRAVPLGLLSREGIRLLPDRLAFRGQSGARARGVPQLRGRIRSPRHAGNETVHRASARGSFPLPPDRSRRRRALPRAHHSSRLRALRP